MAAADLYRPPAPRPMTPVRSLLRVVRQGDGDLLSLVPRAAYEEPLTWLGYSRRSILLVNDPALCREVLADATGIFPKNDLMVGALEGLVGDSIFVSSGATWRRQRRMIDPAFSHIRITTAFGPMVEAVDAHETILDGHAAAGEPFSLDLAMSHLTADVICRTIFSTSLDSSVAREVFDDFLLFERSVASVNLYRLIAGRPWAKVAQPPEVVAACARIRARIGELLDPRLEAARAGNASADDIVGAIIDARDPETGMRFTREELIDQIGVFFLAGHETTASVLTWTFFVLSQRPDVAARIRTDVAELVGDGPVEFGHVRRLPYLRNVFREALRLYPPITFLPRVAEKRTTIGGVPVKRGAMIMISPWTAHRNARLWADADRFDPDRFERGDDADRGVHMSFGVGPRVCIGASFATTEAVLILARLVRRYDVEALDPDAVRPVARLTTRPADEIRARVTRADAPAASA